MGDAVPFGLKTMEGLLEESPRHRGLLLAGVSGFVQYAYGWVQLEADIVEAKDLPRATEMRERGAKAVPARRGSTACAGSSSSCPALRDATCRATRRPPWRAVKREGRAAPLLDGAGAGPGRSRSRSTTPS